MSVEPLHSQSRCVICASDIDARARKCVKCDAYQDGAICGACGLTMPRDAKICPSCKELREGVSCKDCGTTIDPGARRCSECESWQSGWRRLISGSEVALALILSIISVVAALARPVLDYISNRSNTYIRVVGDYSLKLPDATLPEETIQVLVTNTGQRDSVIKSAKIAFDPPIDATGTVELMNSGDIVIEPGKHNNIYLTGTIQPAKGSDVLEQVKKHPEFTATITLVIVETDRHDIATDTPRTHTIEIAKITKWMNSHVVKE